LCVSWWPSCRFLPSFSDQMFCGGCHPTAPSVSPTDPLCLPESPLGPCPAVRPWCFGHIEQQWTTLQSLKSKKPNFTQNQCLFLFSPITNFLHVFSQKTQLKTTEYQISLVSRYNCEQRKMWHPFLKLWGLKIQQTLCPAGTFTRAPQPSFLSSTTTSPGFPAGDTVQR
jgi:hypothetical protein